MIIKDFYHYFLILKSGLFDKKYYLLQYPDVRKSDLNPIWHYIRQGWKEGRNPSPNFNTKFYLDRNPDVAIANINPLIHYINFGLEENRSKNISDSKHHLDISHSRPKVSIVIPVYNALEYTINCIEHIYKSKYNSSFEVIVIDNASRTETKHWLKQASSNYPNLRSIFLEKNIGFGPAVNLGIKESFGEYIVLLNTDTIPSKNWLEKLLQAFESDKMLGIISPLTNFVGEGIQLDPKAKRLSPNKIDEYAKQISDHEEIIYEPSRLVFFCVMLRRSVIDRIGLLDESYIRGNFEDDDYSMRARTAGFKLGVVQNAFVFHHGSASFKENKMDYSMYFDENRKRFYQKVGRISSAFPTFSHISEKTEKHDISVIMRTVDRPELLNISLNSLANQTFQNFEVVLVNDGGPDCSSIINEYEGFLNIQYLWHKESQGRTAALNNGIKSSKGKWISILDDDDIYYPWHLETMVSAIDNSNEHQFYYGNYNRALIDLESSTMPIDIMFHSPYIYSRDSLLLSNRIPINSWFINRKVFNEIGYFDESFDTLEDYEFILRATSRYSILPVKKTVCEYRFYLSQTNSIIRLREDALSALARIYSLYPALDKSMEEERKLVIKTHEKQVEKLQNIILKFEDADNEEIKNLYLHMLSIVGAI